MGNRASTTAGGATYANTYDHVGGLPVLLGDGAQDSCGPYRQGFWPLY